MTPTLRANVGPGGGQAALNRYQNYLTNQVPFIWQQDAPYELTEVKSTLGGVTPQNILRGVAGKLVLHEVRQASVIGSRPGLRPQLRVNEARGDGGSL